MCFRISNKESRILILEVVGEHGLGGFMTYVLIKQYIVFLISLSLEFDSQDFGKLFPDNRGVFPVNINQRD